MKRVLVTLEKGTNYVFHLAAMAGAGFRSAYADKHKGSVSPQDLETLAKYGDRLDFGFGKGRGGDLAPLVLFETACMNLESTREVQEYFSLLDEGLKTGKYGDYLHKYGYAHPDPPDWIVNVDAKWLSQFEPSRDAVRELGEVFVRSYDKWDRGVYPLEAAMMASKAVQLNAHFKNWDGIAKWEEITGFTWKYPEYEIVLCSALEGGPTANSLGYRKNAFYSGHDYEWMIRFISHEVGTHIMMEAMMDVTAKGKYDYYLVYRAFENLARFYNCIVLGEESPYGMAPQYKADEFHSAYSRVRAQEPGIGPTALLEKGIAMARSMEVC